VFLLGSHGSSGDRITLEAGKSYHNAEKIAALGGLSQHIVHGVLSRRLATKNQGASKADLFHFVRQDSVFGYMLYPVIRPNQFPDLHRRSIPRPQR
jgi:hypothetical protein